MLSTRGPGNALIDDLCQARTGQRMDVDGQLTRSGEVDVVILKSLLTRRDYFDARPPKSLDRNDFADWIEAVADLGDADAVCGHWRPVRRARWRLGWTIAQARLSGFSLPEAGARTQG